MYFAVALLSVFTASQHHKAVVIALCETAGLVICHYCSRRVCPEAGLGPQISNRGKASTYNLWTGTRKWNGPFRHQKGTTEGKEVAHGSAEYAQVEEGEVRGSGWWASPEWPGVEWCLSGHHRGDWLITCVKEEALRNIAETSLLGRTMIARCSSAVSACTWKLSPASSTTVSWLVTLYHLVIAIYISHAVLLSCAHVFAHSSARSRSTPF